MILTGNHRTVDETIDLHTLKRLEGSTKDVTRIILVRHGQSAYNVPILIKDGDGVERKVMLVQGASLEVPLTELGQMQANDLLEKAQRKNRTFKPAPRLFKCSACPENDGSF